jgi:hypothetical protein
MPSPPHRSQRSARPGRSAIPACARSETTARAPADVLPADGASSHPIGAGHPRRGRRSHPTTPLDHRRPHLGAIEPLGYQSSDLEHVASHRSLASSTPPTETRARPRVRGSGANRKLTLIKSPTSCLCTTAPKCSYRVARPVGGPLEGAMGLWKLRIGWPSRTTSPRSPRGSTGTSPVPARHPASGRGQAALLIEARWKTGW